MAVEDKRTINEQHTNIQTYKQAILTSENWTINEPCQFVWWVGGCIRFVFCADQILS